MIGVNAVVADQKGIVLTQSTRVTVWRWRVLEKDSGGKDSWRTLDEEMTIEQARDWVRAHGKHLSQIDNSAREVESDSECSRVRGPGTTT